MLKHCTTKKEKVTELLYLLVRICVVALVALCFAPGLNPAKLLSAEYINGNMSLFTSAISYTKLRAFARQALRMGMLQEATFQLLWISCIAALVGICIAIVGACTSLGNNKLRRLGNWFTIGGSVVGFVGLYGIYESYYRFLYPTDANGYLSYPMAAESYLADFAPQYAVGNIVLIILFAVLLISAVAVQILTPKAAKEDRFEMPTRFRLFLMFLPFLALAFVFCYLPLYGWRYGFFEYYPSKTLQWEDFVGLKYLKMLVENEATRSDIVRVLRNTLAMSGLGIATSWVAMAFAIFLSEIKCGPFRRFVQTFTTVPNFISWVLVYAIAYAMFYSDGFINTFLKATDINSAADTNYLMGNDFIWLKMLAWGMWKGTGWSAIIYIAGISGIDQQLYEAATVDGAGRFQKMWHVTLPGLLPTYCVMLLMSIAGILSNGMDQYLVFENAQNKDTILVLDLYIYHLGLEDGLIELSTLIGMLKSVISIVLLFGANAISKAIRGESII